MSTNDSSLTAARLRELLEYDPNTGLFTWLSITSNRVAVGKTTSTAKSDGYVRIGIDGRRYLAHRLVWLYVHGEWPALFIDHINGRRSDNRISNLRIVSRKGNSRNMRVAMKNSESGLLGVSRHRSKWAAKIGVDGKLVHLGVFRTPELAHEAYLIAKRTYHDTCTL